jgi:hypothetical protein
MIFKVNEKKLTTERFSIEFDYEIMQVLDYANLFVVLLKLPPKTKDERNIYGINAMGNQLWRIESTKDAIMDEHFAKNYSRAVYQDIYIHISNNGDGTFSGTTFFAILNKFNPASGKLLTSHFVRW